MATRIKPSDIRKPLDLDADANSNAFGKSFDSKEDMTQQHFKADADINQLVKRFANTGHMPQALRLAEFGDFSEATDYHTAMSELRRGQEAFEQLDPEVREQFGNDPARLWDFLHQEDSESNIRKAVDLGILDKTALDSFQQPSAPPAPPNVPPPSGGASAQS